MVVMIWQYFENMNQHLKGGHKDLKTFYDDIAYIMNHENTKYILFNVDFIVKVVKKGKWTIMRRHV